jgi:8-oxo-dGTP pyrophosphatase MutT (NUDIX family)
MTTTAANAAIPAGLIGRRKTYDHEALKGAKSNAAGVLFVAPDGDVLLLHRAKTEENFPGHWALPGGNADEGETPEQAAIREAREEIGVDADPAALKDLEKVITPKGKAFHTYAIPVAEKFTPRLNGEHTGYAWASLDMLPRPLHPAIDDMLRKRLGVAEDMSPMDWAALRDGLLKWTAEEEREEEHAMAGDSALTLALDRDSVREKRRDGQLVVKRAHITKANVCPYRGSEIPGWQQLGLEPDAIYNLLRDPDELKKAAPTLNGVQLLRKHIPVSADDHQPYDTVGSLGSDAEFVEDGGENYLDNSLFINAADAIAGIESGKKRELSAGYHYTPDMTPGVFRGTRYDGVMRDIVFNHVALVEDGRAGPDVVVGDSMENLMAKPTKLAVAINRLSVAALAPLLAMDQKVTLSKDLFAPITRKNFKDSTAKLFDGVRLAMDGKLRPGMAMDGPLEHLKAAVDAYEELAGPKADEPAPEEAVMQDTVEPIAGEVEGKVFDDGKIADFLRSKGMGEDDIKTVCDMMPKNGMAGDEDDDDDKDKDKDMKDTVTKQAMDEALKAQSTEFDKRLAAVRENERGVRVAINEVRAWVGDLPPAMAFDSAADVYRHALVMKGVDGAKTMHADALLPVLKTLPKIGAKTEISAPAPIAMDTANEAYKLAREIAPGLAAISSI